MPYIDKNSRIDLDQSLDPAYPGELNYCITQILLRYLARCGRSYAIYNDILGALEGAKIEFYRREMLPYENRKRDENGDVY